MPDDVDALITCRIPIKIVDDNSETTKATVSIVLKLEGPEGLYDLSCT